MSSGYHEASDSVVPMIIDGEEEKDDQPETADGQDSPTPDCSDEASLKRVALTVSNPEGLLCAICMEPWESQGPHQICCLPCGHLYGSSCISKWFRQHAGHFAKCPQCNSKCKLKDVIKLYASPVVLLDESLQKKIKSLEDDIISLKTERASLIHIQDDLFSVQKHLSKELRYFKEKSNCEQNAPLEEMGINPFSSVSCKDNQENGGQWDWYFPPNCGEQGTLHCKLQLEHELAVEGARHFDMDASFQFLVLARRISGMGGAHMLQKINLIYPSEGEDLQLPPSKNAIKDIRVSPCGRFTLLASRGKKLSVLSMASNNFVYNYDLPAPAWSCSWDYNHPHYIYTGLQNGMLLVFDMRSSLHPLQSLDGLTSRPIHTIHSVVEKRSSSCTTQKLLTASSSGPCLWNTGSPGERPILIPGAEDRGVCTSLAYSPLSDDIVASYRSSSQASNQNVGSQVLIKRVDGGTYGCIRSVPAQVSDFQLTKSAIINVPSCYPLFACGDEVTRGLKLLGLPDLSVSQNFEPHQHSILDVKYAHSQGKGLLGCVSEDKLQVFSAMV